MATPEAALVSLLINGPGNPVAAIVGTRVYPIILPQAPTLPAIRYQRISTTRMPYRLLSGPGPYAKPRFQIDCYATTPAAAKNLADAVLSVLDGFAGPEAGIEIGSMAPENEWADSEDGVAPGGAPVYLARLDFMMGHAE